MRCFSTDSRARDHLKFAAGACVLSGLAILLPSTAQAQSSAPASAPRLVEWAEVRGPPDHRLFVRVAAGVGYLRERWSPHNGSANAVYTGWAPSIEVAAGRPLLPRLVVGGMWQFVVAVNPNESYLRKMLCLSL